MVVHYLLIWIPNVHCCYCGTFLFVFCSSGWVRLSSYRPTTLKPENFGVASTDNQSIIFLFRRLTIAPVVLSTYSVGFSQSYRSPNSLPSTLLMIFLHVLSTVSLSQLIALPSSLPWWPGLSRRWECKRTPAGGQEILIPAFDSFLSPLKGTGDPSRFRSSKDRGACLKENPDSG